VPTQVRAAWLDPELTDTARVATTKRECAMADFESYPVSTRVSTPRNKDEKPIDPVFE
jgi:putative SOS response-associated peptidase YedK